MLKKLLGVLGMILVLASLAGCVTQNEAVCDGDLSVEEGAEAYISTESDKTNWHKQANGFAEVTSEAEMNIATERILSAKGQSDQYPSDYYGHINHIPYFVSEGNDFEVFSLHNGTKTVQYAVEEAPQFYQIDIINEQLIIVSGYVREGAYQIRIEKIHDGSIVPLFERDCAAMPYICVAGEKMLLNYNVHETKGLRNILALLDVDTAQLEYIAESSYISQEGKDTGEAILYAGGNDRYIYYQRIVVSGEPLEQADEAEIIKFDRDTQQAEIVKWSKSLVMHVAGNGKYFITSEYDYAKPLDDSGKLYENRKVRNIPQISSGNDIMQSYFDEDKSAVLLSGHHYYFYDFEQEKCYWQPFEALGETISQVIANQNEISFVEYATNGDVTLVIKTMSN